MASDGLLMASLIRWGDEITLRNKVMLFLEQWYSVPSVLLVVQGGPGTLATILEAIKTTTPVVVVKGTGGAADAVAGYLAGWNSETRTSQFKLQEYEGGKFLRSQAELGELCAIEATLGLFFPIELRDSSEGLDSTILRAIVRKHRAPVLESHRRAREEELAMSLGREPVSPGDSLTTSQTSDALLTPARSNSLSQTVDGERGGFVGLPRGLKLDRSIRLAVQWDRVEVLRDILADRVQEVLLLRQEAEAFSAAGSEGLTLGTARLLRRKRHAHAQQALEHDLQAALQLSLELIRPSVVEVLLEHHTSLAKVNLCALWTIQGGDKLGMYRISAPLRELHKRPYNLRSLSAQEEMNHFRRYVVPLLDLLLPAGILFSSAFERRCKNARLNRKGETGAAGAAGTAGAPPPPTPQRGGVSSGGRRSTKSNPQTIAYDPSYDVADMGDGTACSFIRSSDVFFWAVAHGNWELAHVLWAATKDPVCCSLLASQMCKSCAGLLVEQRERMLDQADVFEQRAVSVLDHLPAEVAADRSYGFLLQPSADWGCHLIDLAWEVEAKQFMRHPHCRKVTQDLENSTKRLALPDQYSELNSLRSAEIVLTALVGWLPRWGVTSLLHESSDLEVKDWEVKKRKKSLREQRLEQPKPLTSFGKWSEFVRIPRVKLVLRNNLYLLYLLVYVLLFFSHTELDDHKCDSTWAPRVDLLLHGFTLWTVAIFFDELHSASISFYSWHRSFSTWLEGISLTIVFYALALLYYSRFALVDFTMTRRCGEDSPYYRAEDNRSSSAEGLSSMASIDLGGAGERRLRSSGTTDDGTLLDAPTGLEVLIEPEFVLGLAAVPMFIRRLHAFTADRKMGVLIVIIEKMLSDVALFFRLVGSLLIGFGIAFVGILKTQAAYLPISRYEEASMAEHLSLVATEQGWTLSSALGVPLWATVGESQLEVLTASSPFWGTALLWIFVLIAQVLLVNLLIAMMGTTYSAYNAYAEQEYYFSRVRSLMEYRSVAPVPPPFSLLFWLLYLLPCSCGLRDWMDNKDMKVSLVNGL